MTWWRRLLRYARPQRRGLAAIAGLTLLEVGLGVLQPWPLKLVVDHALGGAPLPPAASGLAALPGGGSPLGLVAWLAVLTVLLFVAAQAMALGKTLLLTGVSGRTSAALAADVLDHVQRLAPPVFATHKVGDLTARIVNDSRCVSILLLNVLFPAASSLLMLGTMFAVMFGLDPTLSIVALLFALPMVLLIRWFAQPMTARSLEQADMEGRLMTSAEQVLTALPEVQAFTAEAREDERFDQQARRTIRSRLRTLAVQLQFTTAVGVLTALGTAAILLLGGWHVVDGTLSIGGLLVFLAYLAALYAPLETVAYLAAGRAQAEAGARRVLQILDTDDGVPEPARPRSLPALPPGRRGHVRLEQVVFGYEPGRPILDGVTLEAKPGETVALVGRTGAGKTTLLSLVPRFFDPWSGRVTFDGIDVRELRRDELRRQIAVVSQHSILLPLSVAENIAYGRPAASRDAIEAAAVAAHADAFIRRLPNGYDTVLGERGATLSGGERQRLAIARALLTDAPVLILDEPTSALDAETEAALVAALRRLLRQRTSFVIAHRLSTVQHADRIVVLDGGRIVESGAHAELVARGGLYQHFSALQLGAAAGT